MKPGREGERTPDEIADAVVVAVLRTLERNGADREVLADITHSAQAAVYAAEARNHNRR